MWDVPTTTPGVGAAQTAAQFDSSGQQNEEHEHRDGVVIDLAGLRPSGVNAAEVGKAEAEHDWHVHAKASVAQVTPGADEGFLRSIVGVVVVSEDEPRDGVAAEDQREVEQALRRQRRVGARRLPVVKSSWAGTTERSS